jgi:hypothetical protein
MIREFIAFQFVKISSSDQMMTSFFNIWELRLELMSMTLKQNDSHFYGRALIRHTQENTSALKSGNRGYPFCSSIAPLFILSLFQRTIRLIRIIIWKL